MIEKLCNIYKNFEEITRKILRNGLLFCFGLCVFSSLILFIYTTYITTPIAYYIGINLFKLSLFFGIEFIICSLVIDGIKKQLI